MAWAHALHSDASTTVEEYLRLERLAEERHEYLDGVIYAMAGESPDHGRICVNLTISLGAQLRRGGCEVFSKDLKIQCGLLPRNQRSGRGLFAYPDLVVVCGALAFHDQAQEVLINPTVIIEVLSPSTEAFDRGEKFERYRHWLPSLQDYVLVAQERPTLDHYHRTAPDLWTLTTGRSLDASLGLDTIGACIPLCEVYERVAFPATPGNAQG